MWGFLKNGKVYLNLRWFFFILVIFEFSHLIGRICLKPFYDINWLQVLANYQLLRGIQLFSYPLLTSLVN